MRFGSYVKVTEECGEVNPASFFGSHDESIYKQGYKRVGPIQVMQGQDRDDFVRNLRTIVFRSTGYRIPRFLNPLRHKQRIIG